MFEQHLQGEDEEFVVPPHSKYEFKLTTEQKIATDTLVIALYGPAALFAHSLVTSKSPNAKINFSKAKQISLADVYINDQTKMAFLIFNDEPQKMKEIYFAQFIEQNFSFKKIIILCHEYINNLEKKSKVSLQHLKTNSWKDNAGCNQYQEGLMGKAADVLVWAEIKGTSACCFVGLFNDYELSKDCIKEVFGILIGKEGMEQVSEIGEKIKKYNMKKYSNSLYL